MGKLKARLSVFLCILFVLPAVLGFIPRTSIVAHAATSVQMSWAGGMNYTNPALTVEAGQKFNIGDFMLVIKPTSTRSASTISSVSYTSSKPSVASCKNGIIKTRKAGTAVLTVSYRGITNQCTLTVVDKGTLNMDAYKSLDSKAADVLKVYGNKISTQNQYQVYNLLSKCMKEDTTNVFGLRLSKENGYYTQTNELVAIHMAQAFAVENILDEYVSKISPIGTASSKTFKITSVNAKSGQSQFTIGVKSKLTANQIFAIKATPGYEKSLKTGNTAKFNIYVRDKSTGHIYSGKATVEQGSNNITVQMKKFVLKKNRTYQLLAHDQQIDNLQQAWTLGKTFKAK